MSKAHVAVKPVYDREGGVLAAEGETCERVPAEAVEHLELKGVVKRVAPVFVEAPLKRFARKAEPKTAESEE
jgi:hypothetical protein